MAQVLRLYIQMFLSYWLYVCIILIIGLLSEYFATLIKRLNLKKIAAKCSIFLHWLYFFLMGRSRTLGGNKDQILSGEGKRKGWEGVWGKDQNEGFFAKFPLLSEIQTLSHKLLVRQTSNHHHCNWHAQTPTCRDFQVILSNSSWSKTTLFKYFKEQIWLPNRKCYGKR